MSGTALTAGRNWIDVAWALFAAANVALILLFSRWEAIPFHLVWLSLTLVYWLRLWSLRRTLIVLAIVAFATGTAEGLAAERLADDFDEIVEVPLLAAMFLAVVWHARRRQRALEEVREVAERNWEFVSNASHELRTPITVVRGYVQLMRAAHPGDSEPTGIILHELGRITRISDRLLALAMAEHPELLQRTPIDLCELVEHAAERWRVVAPRSWEVAAPPRASLLADEERLACALDAMLENAIQFTNDGGDIRIAARMDGDAAVIEVADGGSGIAPEDLPRVFDRFVRLGEERNGGRRGTGLGLAMVKAIVEAHGGSIAVASELGRGTTFTMRLKGVPAGGTALDLEPTARVGLPMTASIPTTEA